MDRRRLPIQRTLDGDPPLLADVEVPPGVTAMADAVHYPRLSPLVRVPRREDVH